MELKKTMNELRKLEEISKKKGYLGDATEYSFRRHTLILLKDIKDAIKEDSKQKKYLWQTIDEKLK